MHPSGFDAHDHDACIARVVEEVTAACVENGLRFTPVRRRVLEILLQEHRALGAYDILEILRRDGHAAQPPVAYRALDFLVEHRFAHRIEGLNAFVACVRPGADHTAAFLICRKCNIVSETTLPLAAFETAAAQAGFRLEGTIVEAKGLCPMCQDASA